MNTDKILYLGKKNLIIKEGFNVRYDYGNLDELAQSIKENGLKMPMRGYSENGKYVITDGHRRYYALDKLGSLADEIKVPFLLEAPGYSSEKRVIDLVVTNEGKKLTVLEEAEVYGRLLDYGWNTSDIAKRVGKSLTHIMNCCLLLSASHDVKKKIKSEKVSATMVIDMLKNDKSEKVVEKIEAAEKETKGKKVTAKHIEPKVKEESKKLDQPFTKPSTQRATQEFKFKELVEIRDTLMDVIKVKNHDTKAFDVLNRIIDFGNKKIVFGQLKNYFIKED